MEMDVDCLLLNPNSETDFKRDTRKKGYTGPVCPECCRPSEPPLFSGGAPEPPGRAHVLSNSPRIHLTCMRLSMASFDRSHRADWDAPTERSVAYI